MNFEIVIPVIMIDKIYNDKIKYTNVLSLY
jgi:hypothetical protein